MAGLMHATKDQGFALGNGADFPAGISGGSGLSWANSLPAPVVRVQARHPGSQLRGHALPFTFLISTSRRGKR
jgi:hypothetical protein